MPKVSVIIPTYNRRDFVREAVASVLAQTYGDFELLVVDDGSDDDTAAVVREFDGVRYVFQPNRGVSAARNRGAALSGGELLAFLDSDDLWQPRKLEYQVAFFATHPQTRICQTEEIWLRHGVRVNPRNKHRKVGGDIFARSLELCLVSPSAAMLRRELFERVGGFDESLPACEDYDLWLRIAATEAIHLIETPLVIKRGGHADQLSRRFWGMDRFRVAALCKLLDSGALSPEQRRLTEDTLRTKCNVLAQGACKRGKDGEPYLALAAAYANGAEVKPQAPSPCPPSTTLRTGSPTKGEGTYISQENKRAGAC
jgi:glycosyltransferase involved in cell wall biosynthesis